MVYLEKIVMQQKQTAGSRSTQVQLGISEQDDDSRVDQKMGNIKQTQIAHEDSVQIQIGSVKYVRKQQKCRFIKDMLQSL